MVYNIDDLVGDEDLNIPFAGLPDGKWVVAKPAKAPLNWRIKAAWKVLTGEYDAVKYTGQK